MREQITNLLSLLDLEFLEQNLFRGQCLQTSWQRAFGGQVVAQSLVAAQRTVSADRHVHSLHCYFLTGGDPSTPIIYQVERMRDGASFSMRRVTAIQHGRAIFSAQASFQRDESGLEHQIAMPAAIPAPEALRDLHLILRDNPDRVPEHMRDWARDLMLDARPVDFRHYEAVRELPPHQQVWIRPHGSVPDDRGLRCAVLAYLSDMCLLDTATFAHGRLAIEADMQLASLDHAMWFHRDRPLDDWLLYAIDSPSTCGGRGLTRGFLYSRDGTLIASVAQEGVVRLRSKAAY